MREKIVYFTYLYLVSYSILQSHDYVLGLVIVNFFSPFSKPFCLPSHHASIVIYVFCQSYLVIGKTGDYGHSFRRFSFCNLFPIQPHIRQQAYSGVIIVCLLMYGTQVTNFLISLVLLHQTSIYCIFILVQVSSERAFSYCAFCCLFNVCLFFSYFVYDGVYMFLYSHNSWSIFYWYYLCFGILSLILQPCLCSKLPNRFYIYLYTYFTKTGFFYFLFLSFCISLSSIFTFIFLIFCGSILLVCFPFLLFDSLYLLSTSQIFYFCGLFNHFLFQLLVLLLSVFGFSYLFVLFYCGPLLLCIFLFLPNGGLIYRLLLYIFSRLRFRSFNFILELYKQSIIDL